MIKNYFKTAWRNLIKSKGYSAINIGGLAIGMAVALIIGLWIHDEIFFDKKFEHYDRIAQVIQNVTNNGEVQTWHSVPYPLAGELRKNYGSDFKQVVLEASWGDHILAHEDKKLGKKGAFFEKGAPELFSLNILRGRSDLNDPSSALISESAAKAFFGKEDPLNKVLKIDNQFTVKVSGVYEDFSSNSTFADMSFMAPWDLLYNQPDGIKTMTDPWRPNGFRLYVLLNDQSDIHKVSLRIRDAKLKNVNAQLAKKKPALFLQPMSEWHLYSEYKNGVNTGGAIQYVWLFGLIGIFVLFLACINFMNLSTARSEKRAMEVCIRKTLGSMRRQLVFRFFSESLLTVLLAFCLCLIIVKFSLPFFNEISSKELLIPWFNPLFWLIALCFIFITGLIAGSYPSFYLSSFKPIKVLKGSFKTGRFAAIPRKVLVVVQFSVSVILIIGTIIVYRQIEFAKDRPVGYDRNRLFTLNLMTPALQGHFPAFKQELMESGTISSVTASGSPTTGIWNSTSGFDWKGKDPNLSTDFGVVSTSFDYGKTLRWEIESGRDFSNAFGTDSSSLILNEAAVRYTGLKNPVGETVTWWGRPYKVIGVVKNIIMESPYLEVKPVIYTLSPDDLNVVIFSIKPDKSTKEALSKIEPIFKKYNPDQPFDYKFVDEDYAGKFLAEERIGKLSGIFASLAIFISCLGLFGLASFIAEQRSREIGLRKVLGASVFSLWRLLLKDFVILVLIACLISGPVASFLLKNWLMHYEYHTQISWWVFAVASIGALLITLFTVSYQALRAAFTNPVKNLRSE